MEAPLRTLIVDDSPVHAGLVVASLRGYGMEIAPARVSTRETMKAALDGQSWDVVIANDRIRTFDTPGILELLESLTGELPCIFIADNSSEGAEPNMFSLAWLGAAVECKILQIQMRNKRSRKRTRKRSGLGVRATSVQTASVSA